MLQRPPRLARGDRLAAVTLSWGGPGAFPDRYATGKRQLEEALEVELVEMPHTLASPEDVAADPRARADDLHAALADPSIAGVVSTIGGDDSIRVLPYLDLDLIAAHPKVFLGYSDTTATHLAFRRAGVVSFYGPSVMAGFGETGGMHDYLLEGVVRTLFEPAAPLDWPANEDGWTAEHLDWADPTTRDQTRRLQPSTGRRWLGGTAAEGPVLAACVEVLDWFRGTDWWPNLDGVVLLLETSEEAPPPELLARFLRVLALTGELQGLSGLLLGRPGGADVPVADHVDYDEAVLRVVRDEAGLADLPVVTNVDVGHTDPMWTVPQGVRLRVEPEVERLTFLEAGVR